MLTVFGALVPVFLLIVLGFALRRVLLKKDIEWVGLEQLVYYVLFPGLLIDTLARANLGEAYADADEFAKVIDADARMLKPVLEKLVINK